MTIRTAEVPHGTEYDFGFVSSFFMPGATAAERFAVVHHFLKYVEPCQSVGIDIFAPLGIGFVLVVNQVVDCCHKCGEVFALLSR